MVLFVNLKFLSFNCIAHFQMVKRIEVLFGVDTFGDSRHIVLDRGSWSPYDEARGEES